MRRHGLVGWAIVVVGACGGQVANISTPEDTVVSPDASTGDDTGAVETNESGADVAADAALDAGPDCTVVGETCVSSSECCGSACLPDAEAGVCGEPGTCIEINMRCGVEPRPCCNGLSCYLVPGSEGMYWCQPTR